VKVKIVALIILGILLVASVATIGELFASAFDKRPIGSAPEPQKTKDIIYPPLSAQKTKDIIYPPLAEKTKDIIYPPLAEKTKDIIYPPLPEKTKDIIYPPLTS